MKNVLAKLYLTIADLKNNRRAVLWLIAIDLALAVSSNVVDWPWLIRVPPHLIVFAPICSLYPVLLVIWWTRSYFNKKIPAWFTGFLFMGLVSYGLMAWFYFSAYMSWNGVNFHDVGSIFWVTAYAFQAIPIASQLKKIPIYQYLFIFGYFFFKDYSDRYLGTFLDVLLPNYPENLKLFLVTTMIILHIGAAVLLVYIPRRKKHYSPEDVSTMPFTSTP